MTWVLRILVLCCLGALPARSETLVRTHCLGNVVESCFVVIDGPIEKGLTARIRQEFPRGFEAPQVFLNSPGGDLGEALRLGRYIREVSLSTAIGARLPPRLNADGTESLFAEGFPKGGRCESACAYAFMGGEKRVLQPDNRLGLHRFRARSGGIDGDSAQVIAGQLVSYMVEMGVDARVFRLAAEQGDSEMYFVSRDEALDFDLITPSGFDALFMEPYKGGVIAASRRLDPTGPYDSATQITFFCRRGAGFALIRAEGGWLSGLDVTPEPKVTVDATDMPVAGPVTIRSSDTDDFLTVPLTRSTTDALGRAETAVISVWFPRVAGGNRGVALELSGMDRQMIVSAMTHCIG